MNPADCNPPPEDPHEGGVVPTALEDARHQLEAMHGLLAADGADPGRRWTIDTAGVVGKLGRAIALRKKEVRE